MQLDAFMRVKTILRSREQQTIVNPSNRTIGRHTNFGIGAASILASLLQYARESE